MKKIKFVGLIFVVTGLFMLVIGGFITYKAKTGLTSLQAVYEIQNVMMSYDEDGNFTDRGTTKDGDAILSLLMDDWLYPLNKNNLDPNDPLVNTPDELMVQLARINYHVSHGTQTIVLEEDVEYKGELFEAGTYEFEVDGRYWQDFDRNHPLEGPAREMAWTATAHGLLANLSAGVASHNFVIFVFYFGLLVVGLGAVFLVSGISLASASITNNFTN